MNAEWSEQVSSTLKRGAEYPSRLQLRMPAIFTLVDHLWHDAFRDLVLLLGPLQESFGLWLKAEPNVQA